MKIEKYFIEIYPEIILLNIVKEKVLLAKEKLESCEKFVKERLGDKANGINLSLWIGNSVKSASELVEFLDLLKKKGLEENDIKSVEKQIVEVRELLGY
jgi:hypothetical protein